MFRRLWRETVWSPNGVPKEDWPFRGLFRWVLPLTDVFFIWFGLAGWWQGINTVQEAASPAWQVYWSSYLAIAATIALVGVAFPRLWWLELCAKVPLISLVSVYIVVLLERGLTMPQVQATAGLVVILVLTPIWRVWDLSGNLWDIRIIRHTIVKVGLFFRPPSNGEVKR